MLPQILPNLDPEIAVLATVEVEDAGTEERGAVPARPRIGAEAHRQSRSAPERMEIDRLGEPQEGGEVAPALRHALEIAERGGLRHLLQAPPVEHPFGEGADVGQDRLEAQDLAQIERPRRPTRAEGETVRPLARDEPHDLEQTRPRRQEGRRRRATHGDEPLGDRRVPRLGRIGRAREVRHEEEVEMGQMVRDVLRRVGERRRARAVGGRLEPGEGRDHPCRRDRLRDRTDAADARCDHQRVLERPADQDLFEAAIERHRHLRRDDHPVLDVEMNLEVALDPIERPDHHTAHVSLPSDPPRRGRPGGTTT